ncbi:hypothetical protein GH714_039227 [Hevea brasiliensis]|uniref:Brix domain-containing protein n=1 Tax=Hevea brasiliensis TaxID=3981 RepID=A0A6A6MTB6_HEVBR|nr:hypothetical protein GH714_039227 [Hevea brasiliensis]
MVHGSVELDAVSKEAVDLENMPLEEVFDQIKCRREGLSSDEVQERLDLFGYNKLEEKKENKILKFLGFMWNPLSWVMEAAALMAIALAHGGGKSADYHDFFGILILLLINSTISFIEEAAALMARLAPKAKVLRNGKWSEEDASELVPPLILGISKMNDHGPPYIILSRIMLEKKRKISVKPVVKKNQGNVDHVTGDKIPKSFVFSRGKLPGPLKQLHMDLRKLMLPYTALNLREKKRNNLRDFLNVLGPMGVTHFLILSKIETASYLRVARTSQGPTLTFKIHEYSTAQDVAQSLLRPRCPQDLFKNPQLFAEDHQVPDLRSLQDVSDFVTKAGYGSESEADDEAATVTLASDLGRVNRASTKSAVSFRKLDPE